MMFTISPFATTFSKVNNFTVEPVYKDHPREHNTMVFVQRWSLITGSFMQKMSNWKKYGCYRQGIAIPRWS